MKERRLKGPQNWGGLIIFVLYGERQLGVCVGYFLGSYLICMLGNVSLFVRVMRLYGHMRLTQVQRCHTAESPLPCVAGSKTKQRPPQAHTKFPQEKTCLNHQ